MILISFVILFLVLTLVTVYTVLVPNLLPSSKTITISVGGYQGIPPSKKIMTSNGNYPILFANEKYEIVVSGEPGIVLPQDIVGDDGSIWKIENEYNIAEVDVIMATVLPPGKKIILDPGTYIGDGPIGMFETNLGQYPIIKESDGTYTVTLEGTGHTINTQNIEGANHDEWLISTTGGLDNVDSLTVLVNKTIHISVEGYEGEVPIDPIKTNTTYITITKNDAGEFSFINVGAQDVLMGPQILGLGNGEYWKVEGNFDLSSENVVTVIYGKNMNINVGDYEGNVPTNPIITSNGSFFITSEGDEFKMFIPHTPTGFGSIVEQEIKNGSIIWIIGSYNLDDGNELIVEVIKRIQLVNPTYKGGLPIDNIRTSDGDYPIKSVDGDIVFDIPSTFTGYIPADAIINGELGDIWSFSQQYDLKTVEEIPWIMKRRVNILVSDTEGPYIGSPPDEKLTYLSQFFSIQKENDLFFFDLVGELGTLISQDIIDNVNHKIWKLLSDVDLSSVREINMQVVSVQKRVLVDAGLYDGPAPSNPIITSNGEFHIEKIVSRKRKNRKFKPY